MIALVFDGKIVQIEPAEFPVAPALQWVDITGIAPAPKVGWSYDGASFAPPLGPSLSELKNAKRAEFIAESVTRIAAQVPDWDTLDTVKTVAGLWVSHLATNATTAQLAAKDIYLYAKNIVPSKLATITDQAALDAVDPTATDPFGDGTLWPTQVL